MDFEDRYYLRRIRHTFVAVTFVYVGGTMIRISVMETFRTFWGIPVFVAGGLLVARGLRSFNIAQNLRQPLNLNGPERVGIPLAPEERVGIPLAPEERGDPELEIEGLLLHHDLDRIWPQRRNVVEPPVAVNDGDGIRPDPAEGNPEEAVLLLNDPLQDLNLRDEAGIEEAEGDDDMQLQEVAVRGDILLPLAEGDPEEAVVGLVLNDPPQDLNFIDEAGIEEEEDDDAMQVQEVAAENDVRVDILLPPAEGEPELAMVGIELNDPPQALNLRDEAGVEQAEGNDAMQLQAVVVDNSVRMDIRPAAVEEVDVEWAMEAIELDDLLERIGEAGAEQGASSDVEQAQEAIGIDRVGIHLGPDEASDSSLLAGGLILHQNSSQINASAVYLKKEDVVPCLESEKEKKSPIEEPTPQSEEQETPRSEEQETPRSEEQQTPRSEEQETPQSEEQETPRSKEQETPRSEEQTPQSEEQTSEEQSPVQPEVMLD